MKRAIFHRSLGLALWVGVGLLPGCDLVSGLLGDEAAPASGAGDKPARPARGAEAKAAAKKAPEAEAPPAPVVEPYTYNMIGKRDPFKPFLQEQRMENANLPRTPLQRYDIDQYTLVGVVLNSDPSQALVEDPQRRGYVMKLGTYIGKNWGKVTDIQADRVIITEEYQTLEGDLVTNPITMALPSATPVEDQE